MAEIRTERVVKTFGTVAAVNQVDLTIKDGSFTTILGPSGSGKTTLLRLIAGLLDVDSGKVFIGGKDSTHLSVQQRNQGFVFQQPTMFPHMTVYQNIAWALQLRKWSQTEIADRIDEMLQLVRLTGLEQRVYRQLSSEQAQRVVIARALAPQPDVLYLDEPYSQLDATLRDELKLEIVKIQRKTGCTTLMATHDQASAWSLADHVLLMNQGKIVQEGEPLAVYRNPTTRFSAEFTGVNNLLSGTITATATEIERQITVQIDNTHLSLVTACIHSGLTIDSKVWVCVRADDIDIVNVNDIVNEIAIDIANYVVNDNPNENNSEIGYVNIHSICNSDPKLRGNRCTAVVEQAQLARGTMIVHAQVGGQRLRIHAGGSQRFDLLNKIGKTITCSFGHFSIIAR